MFAKLSAIVCLILALTACNPATALRDKAVDAQIRATFDQLRSTALLNPDAFTPEAAATLTPQTVAAVRAEIPAQAPKSRKPLATSVTHTPGGSTVEAADEYQYADRTLIVRTLLQRPSDATPWKVAGFHVQAVTAAQVAANRFGAPGKSIGQYLFLAMTALSPLLMVAALVKVIRTRGLRLKWLWGIVAFLGLMQFQMNWTTGAVFVNYLTLQIIGFGVLKGPTPDAPWLLTFTLPIGAALILAGVLANPKRAKPKAPPAEEAF